jgi:hypothetical protein
MNFPYDTETSDSHAIIHDLVIILRIVGSQNYIGLPNEPVLRLQWYYYYTI